MNSHATMHSAHITQFPTCRATACKVAHREIPGAEAHPLVSRRRAQRCSRVGGRWCRTTLRGAGIVAANLLRQILFHLIEEIGTGLALLQCVDRGLWAEGRAVVRAPGGRRVELVVRQNG